MVISHTSAHTIDGSYAELKVIDLCAPRTLRVIVVVTGANGLVGSRLCAALAGRGASVRAVVRRTGAMPAVPGVAEQVGDFTGPGCRGAAPARRAGR
ncbi:MAG: NAD-dependent epimerase/dehydratase family protein [Frankiaceae bacterium]|nr:NAD-dependent epimerase/dehydratase family protein [Frankiaceae bacterium]